jgi:hypothetical protein
MQFFLYEVVARIVAVYLCVVCYRILRDGLIERKVAVYSSDPIDWVLDTFTDPSIRIAHRDTAPARYWIFMGLQVLSLIGCCGVAILGWWHPTT